MYLVQNVTCSAEYADRAVLLVPFGLRAVAMLVVLTVLLASGSQITIVAALMVAIYVGYWFATPRPWSVWLALLTAPAALAAIARSETGQVTYLLWVCPALAIGFANLLVPIFPLPITYTTSAYAILPVIAVVVGVLASLAGVRRAVRTDPAAAFAGT